MGSKLHDDFESGDEGEMASHEGDKTADVEDGAAAQTVELAEGEALDSSACEETSQDQSSDARESNTKTEN